VVPSHRAVWIPAGVGHSIAMSGWVSMRTLYIVPKLVAALPRRCCVVGVPPLLRALILHAIEQSPLRRTIPEHRRLVAFLLDQLRVLVHGLRTSANSLAGFLGYADAGLAHAGNARTAEPSSRAAAPQFANDGAPVLIVQTVEGITPIAAGRHWTVGDYARRDAVLAELGVSSFRHHVEEGELRHSRWYGAAAPVRRAGVPRR